MRGIGARCRLLAACLIVSMMSAPATAAPPTIKALVLYTSDSGVAYGNVGKLYAILLGNLLDHFATNVEIREAGACAPGEATTADALFFIGFIQGRAVAQDLLRAIAARKGPTVWFRDGIDQFLGAASGARLGVSFVGMHGFDAAGGSRRSFFDTV